MSGINWGVITNGATFESMATSLICFEDPDAALMGRAGRDDGQDARSSDRATVYQAKFHRDESPAAAIRDAKKEADKIGVLLAKDGTGASVWAGVTRWILVTNASFNARDRARWDKEVSPLFEAHGLTAVYWERPTLEALLAKHPEVRRAYFDSGNRVFISLQEARELPSLRMYPDALAATFQGRKEALAAFSDFLANDHKRIFILHGAGGVGKSRFLLEAGEANASSWRPLWANVATMARSDAWFGSIVPERPTVVLVDDPEDAEPLKVLIEQVSAASGRTGQWKVAIGVRSPNDPVLGYVQSPQLARLVVTLPIDRLERAEAESFARELVEASQLRFRDADWKTGLASFIASRFDQFPIWIAMAVEVAALEHGLENMPQTADALAATYLREITLAQTEFDRSKLLETLRWISLLRPFNTENEHDLDWLREKSGLADATELRRCLSRLVDRRVLFVRGARSRLLELKPDVLADHVQRAWLIQKVSFGATRLMSTGPVAGIADEILESIAERSFERIHHRLLLSLVRVELIQSYADEPVDLLGGFVQQLGRAMPTYTAMQQLVAVEVLRGLAPSRPTDVLALVRVILDAPPASEQLESVFGKRTVTATDVFLQLPWTVFLAGTHATTASQRSETVECLSRLAALEGDHATALRLPNDGRRAAPLLQQLVAGGPDVRTSYVDEAMAFLLGELDRLGSDGAPLNPFPLVAAAAHPILSIEKQRTSSDDRSVTIHRYIPHADSDSWRRRGRVVEKLRCLLGSDALHPAGEPLLWKLMAEAHSAALTARLATAKDEKFAPIRPAIEAETRASLEWTADRLELSTPAVSSLREARKIWEWHIKFEKNAEVRALAERCQAVLEADAIYAEIDPITTWSTADKDRVCEDKAIELARRDADAIRAFIDRVIAHLRDVSQIYRASGVAIHLGRRAQEALPIQQFVEESLRSVSDGPYVRFARVIAQSWIESVRLSSNGEPATQLRKLMEYTSTPVARAELLSTVLAGAPHSMPTAEEVQLLIDHRADFREASRSTVWFNVAASVVLGYWDTARRAIEHMFDELPAEEYSEVFPAFADSFHLAARVWTKGEHKLGPEHVSWFLAQLLRVPDIDDLGPDTFWHVRDFIERAGHPPRTWLRESIESRISLSAAAKHRMNVVPTRERLSSLVEPIGATGDVIAADIETVRALLAMAERTDTVSYALPFYVQDIDPHGRVAPQEIAGRIAAAGSIEEIRRMARLAGPYAQNSPGWRTVAAAALNAGERFTEDDRKQLLRALVNPRPQEWGNAIGEVSQVFHGEVGRAQHNLDMETEDVLKHYWRWQLSLAEARLREEEERAREDRGE